MSLSPDGLGPKRLWLSLRELPENPQAHTVPEYFAHAADERDRDAQRRWKAERRRGQIMAPFIKTNPGRRQQPHHRRQLGHRADEPGFPPTDGMTDEIKNDRYFKSPRDPACAVPQDAP